MPSKKLSKTRIFPTLMYLKNEVGEHYFVINQWFICVSLCLETFAYAVSP